MRDGATLLSKERQQQVWRVFLLPVPSIWAVFYPDFPSCGRAGPVVEPGTFRLEIRCSTTEQFWPPKSCRSPTSRCTCPCDTSIITHANVCDYKRQRCISIQILTKTNNQFLYDGNWKGGKSFSAKIACAHHSFRPLLSPVFGLEDGPYTPPMSD